MFWLCNPLLLLRWYTASSAATKSANVIWFKKCWLDLFYTRQCAAYVRSFIFSWSLSQKHWVRIHLGLDLSLLEDTRHLSPSLRVQDLLIGVVLRNWTILENCEAARPAALLREVNCTIHKHSSTLLSALRRRQALRFVFLITLMQNNNKRSQMSRAPN